MQLKSLLLWTTAALSVNPSFGQLLPNIQAGDVALSGADESEPVAPSAQLIKLNKKNFDSLTSKGTWFIKFFSPYCSHCISMAPAWQKAFDAVGEEAAKSDFYMAEVDCVVNGDLCSKVKITSYPTMQIHKDGKYVEDYDKFGSRKPEAFIKFIKSKLETEEQPVINTDIGEAISGSGTSSLPMNAEGRSVEVHKDLFVQYIAGSRDPWLIKIYSPTKCKECKDSDWEVLEMLAKDKIRVGYINCDNEMAFCTDILNKNDDGSRNSLDIETKLQNPIYRLYLGGKMITYEGPSGVINLSLFFTSALVNYELQTLELSNLESSAKSFSSNEVALSRKIVMAYLYKEDKVNNKQMLALEDFAFQMIGHAVVYKVILTEAVKSRYDLGNNMDYDPSIPTLVALDGTLFDIYPNKYDGFNLERADNLINWAKRENWGPLFGEVTIDNFHNMIEDNMRSGDKDIVLAILDSSDSVNFDAYRQELSNTATSYRNLRKTGVPEGTGNGKFKQKADYESEYPRVQFAWIDGIKNQELLENRFGINFAEFKELQAKEKLTNPSVATSKVIIVNKDKVVKNMADPILSYWDKNLDQEYITINKNSLLEEIPELINTYRNPRLIITGLFHISFVTLLKIILVLAIVYIMFRKFKGRGVNGMSSMFRKSSPHSRGLGLLDGKGE